MHIATTAPPEGQAHGLEGAAEAEPWKHGLVAHPVSRPAWALRPFFQKTSPISIPVRSQKGHGVQDRQGYLHPQHVHTEPSAPERWGRKKVFIISTYQGGQVASGG